MQDNSAYAGYINLIREVLLNTLRERGEVTAPEGFADECITQLQRRWSEIGLTPDVFNPFLERHVKVRAGAIGASATGGSLPKGGTAHRKL